MFLRLIELVILISLVFGDILNVSFVFLLTILYVIELGFLVDIVNIGVFVGEFFGKIFE